MAIESNPFFGHGVAMKRPDTLFKLRLPDEMREPLEAAADESHRSLTAEILERLSASLSSGAPRHQDETVIGRIKGLEEQLKLHHQNIGLYSASARIIALSYRNAQELINEHADVLDQGKLAAWRKSSNTIEHLVQVVEVLGGDNTIGNSAFHQVSAVPPYRGEEEPARSKTK